MPSHNVTQCIHSSDKRGVTITPPCACRASVRLPIAPVPDRRRHHRSFCGGGKTHRLFPAVRGASGHRGHPLPVHLDPGHHVLGEGEEGAAVLPQRRLLQVGQRRDTHLTRLCQWIHSTHTALLVGSGVTALHASSHTVTASQGGSHTGAIFMPTRRDCDTGAATKSHRSRYKVTPPHDSRHTVTWEPLLRQGGGSRRSRHKTGASLPESLTHTLHITYPGHRFQPAVLSDRRHGTSTLRPDGRCTHEPGVSWMSPAGCWSSCGRWRCSWRGTAPASPAAARCRTRGGTAGTHCTAVPRCSGSGPCRWNTHRITVKQVWWYISGHR